MEERWRKEVETARERFLHLSEEFKDPYLVSAPTHARNTTTTFTSEAT